MVEKTTEIRCYRRLLGALMDWKWWNRRPQVISEAFGQVDENGIEENFWLNACNAMDECIENHLWEAEIDAMAEGGKFTFDQFYEMARSIPEPEGWSFMTADFSAREAVLQQIEDLISCHGVLFAEIKRLPLDDLAWPEKVKRLSRVEVMRSIVSDALNYYESLREQHEPESRPA